MDVNARKGMCFHPCLGDILIFTKRGKEDKIEATKKGVVPVNNKEHSPQELARPGNPQWEAWKHFAEEYRQRYGEDPIS